MNLFRKLLCRLGFHKRVWSEKWTPSMGAQIVTEYEHKEFCFYCRKQLSHIHWKWNGEEMEDVCH